MFGTLGWMLSEICRVGGANEQLEVLLVMRELDDSTVCCGHVYVLPEGEIESGGEGVDMRGRMSTNWNQR
mgnify:CR=1 FL=1